MPDEADLPPLREVIARYGLRARRSLGQHFLLDTNLTARIARAAGPLPGHTVFEIGPGPGGLTRALLAAGSGSVLAVELDRRCIEALREAAAAYGSRLHVMEADALETDLIAEAAARGLEGPYKIVANLPYNLSTALLLKWLGEIERYAVLVLMFQREVADRLTAEPGTKAYGRLTVMTRWLTTVERLFNLPAAAFTPPPKVMSTVLRLTPRPEPLAPARMKTLEQVTAAAFGQRRKMLRQSLKSLGVDPAALLAAASVAPTARAEEIGVEGFCALSRAFDDLQGR